ncbi:hypothetical protein AAMO2058_000632900 [Amorphochlora amoebiformis]
MTSRKQTMLGPPWRGVLLVYFATHVPITALIDSQAVLPRHFFPEIIRRLLDWHITTHSDILMENKPNWFRCLIWTEIVLQLPFFVLATWYLAKTREFEIRYLFITYASHVTTTMVPILGTFLLEESLSWRTRGVLIAIYCPYLVVPLAILILFWKMERRGGVKKDVKTS